MTAQRHDGVGPERLAADEAGEREVVRVRVGIGSVIAIPGPLLGHERPGRCLIREERVVELPAVQVVASVVQELESEPASVSSVASRARAR